MVSNASSSSRPPRRPWHAIAPLVDLSMVTWAVAPERLDAALPAGVVAERFVLDDSEVALVSSMSFTNDAFHFRGVPLVRMTAGQIDHRTYVQRNGEQGVWFLAMSLDHRLAGVGRVLWSMPWRRQRVAVTARWDGPRLATMTVDAVGGWGTTAIELDGATPPEPPEVLRSSTVTDQLSCWYPRVDGGTGRYSVWHEPLDLQPATVRHARSRLFEQQGLVDEGQQPLGAMVARRAAFDIHTPPRRARSAS